MSIYEPIETQDDSHRVLQLRSPIDLKPSGTLVCANREEVESAVARARKAQPAWAALSYEQRGEYMQRVLKIVLDKQDHLVDYLLANLLLIEFDSYRSMNIRGLHN